MPKMGEFNMLKALKFALWVAAIGCLAAVPFVALPWSVVDNIAHLFGIHPLPDDPVVMYLVRVSCGVFGLIGVYFIILARNPLDSGPMLDLGAYGIAIFGLLSLFIGLSLNVSPRLFIGDALSGLILGVAIIVLSSKAKKAVNKNL